MKIIGELFFISDYSIKVQQLSLNPSIFQTSGNSSSWHIQDQNLYRLNYKIDYSAIDKNADHVLINYKGELRLMCQIDDIYLDAKKILEIKKRANLSMKNFLLHHTTAILDHLKIDLQLFQKNVTEEQQELDDKHIFETEIKSIKRVMGTLTLEEMSDEERKLRFPQS